MADDPLERLELERREPSGSRREFQEQLALLDERLIDIGQDVSDRIMPVTRAFLEADSHAASELILRDAQLVHRCTLLEETCYVLLATQSPVAADLRRVVAVLRSISDVQRSSNLLSHVAESLAWVHPPSMSQELRDTILQLGQVSSEIVASAIQAWREHDSLAASELERRDDQVDLLQKVLLSELYTGSQSIEESVSLGLIARYYERIADHGVEMAHQLAYFLTGDRLHDRDDTV